MSSRSAILRFILGVFVGLAAAAPTAAAAPPEGSVALRLCQEGCRDDFLQCLIDGGFEEEGPYQVCRAEHTACRERCASACET